MVGYAVSLSSDYSLVDRFLHYIAFCHPAIQKAFCEIENDLFRKQFEGIVSNDEVFVTGLPRSGTTLILDMLYKTGEFSTFTYREMPFVLSPIIWSKITRSFHKTAELKERAHGDGMQVSFDSPEAFEEVIWLTYLKNEIVKPDYLSPLSSDTYNPDFAQAITNSIKKLIYLDRISRGGDMKLRYLSKNNANISRIDVLLEMFPNSTIIVPFRHPLAHEGSLMKQHDRFLKEQATDDFTRRYMKWLGHYEFGESFKPINFDNWLNDKNLPYEVNQDFWLEYWSKAYEFVLKKKNDNIIFLDFDQLLAGRGEILASVAERIGLCDNRKFIEQKSRLRAPNSNPIQSDSCSKYKWASAKEIYEQLTRLAM